MLWISGSKMIPFLEKGKDVREYKYEGCQLNCPLEGLMIEFIFPFAYFLIPTFPICTGMAL